MLLGPTFWALISKLSRHRGFRTRLNSFVLQAQAVLGAGMGGDVAESGEGAVLQLLTQPAIRRRGRDLCVIDVGANKGQYLEAVLQTLGSVDAIVHCFEPSPTAFAVLAERFGGRSDVRLNPVGLGAQPGAGELFTDALGSGLASLTRRDLSHVGLRHDQSERVTVETLDRYCAGHAIDVIDLLKLDVEGHELDVLHGAATMLAQRRIRLVTFEFGGCNIDTKTYVRDFWCLFSKCGAPSFYRIMPSGHLFHIARYDESVELFRTSNFLVVLDETVDTAWLK